jgi:hypothetical protein
MDAGVIDEDGPTTVKRLIFEAQVVTGDSKALIHIKEIEK